MLQDLIHDLLEFHIVPNIKPKANIAPSRKSNLKFKLDSTLIKSDYIPLFSSWIDKKESSHYNKRNTPYNFKLLYCSSRDEFSANNFHRNCDNKGATIWVAKIQGSTQLIGGYNPLDWGGNSGGKITTDSFLFNFTDRCNISTAKLGYVNEPSGAIYCRNDCGPCMGNNKLYYSNNRWNWDSGNTSYPNICNIPATFTVECYEVFQVIKK